jgi:hypothetical protein
MRIEPFGEMRRKAFGTKSATGAAAARASPTWNPSSNPPPAMPVSFMKVRRSSLRARSGAGLAPSSMSRMSSRRISSGAGRRVHARIHRDFSCASWPAALWIAARMRWYVPQRQMLPAMAASMSASVGCGVRASSAAADMSWPAWQ